MLFLDLLKNRSIMTFHNRQMQGQHKHNGERDNEKNRSENKRKVRIAAESKEQTNKQASK